MTEPVEVFTFDFYDWRENLSPLERKLDVPVVEDGVFNGIAFWFELQLDEDNVISTSPFEEKGKTWTQAIQYFEEIKVSVLFACASSSLVTSLLVILLQAHSKGNAGMRFATIGQVSRGDLLPMTAKHDTYGISFKLDDTQIDRAVASTRVPLWDPVWNVQFQRMEKLNSDFVRSIAQNPMEYRQVRHMLEVARRMFFLAKC